jgi:hypothetical protein
VDVSIGVKLETTQKIGLKTVKKSARRSGFVDIVTNMSIYLQKYPFNSPFSGIKTA